ncbi:MAG: antibiotic biosynthesis monooxygenase [Frankiales bacterium]|nr:antibiotic biosynthesis monooxygenase [Frankiales bacterium]
MLVVIAHLNAKPESRDLLANALAKAAAASRGDAGCLSYVFTSDLENPNHFISVETWTDQASLDAHFTMPHLAELFTVAGDALDGAPDITTYETDGPKG